MLSLLRYIHLERSSRSLEFHYIIVSAIPTATIMIIILTIYAMNRYSQIFICIRLWYEFRMMNVVLILMNHCDSTASQLK